jgi:hypothetical protein
MAITARPLACAQDVCGGGIIPPIIAGDYDMQSKPVFGLWRGACLALFAAAATILAMLALAQAPAAAQITSEYKFNQANLSWREYSRDDFGFRIEMPGEPMITVDDTPHTRSQETSADVMFDRVTFGVTVLEFPKHAATAGGAMPAQQANEQLDDRARAFELTYGVAPELVRFTMNGAPGLEYVFEFKESVMHYRTVIHGGRMIQDSFCVTSPTTTSSRRRNASSNRLPCSPSRVKGNVQRAGGRGGTRARCSFSA